MYYLGYGLAQGEGFIVITGDVGAGKTTLVGHLMNTIDSGRLTAVKLVSTQVESDDLLRLVAEQFGIEWGGESTADLLSGMAQSLSEQARPGQHKRAEVPRVGKADISTGNSRVQTFNYKQKPTTRINKS